MLPLFGGPLLLLPLHVVLFELIIDPACSLVFEAEPAPDDLMRQSPRPRAAQLFAIGAILRAVVVGLFALAGFAAIQWWGHRGGWSDQLLRLAGIASIIAANLAMVVWFRSSGRRGLDANPVFDKLLLGVCALLGFILLVPAVAHAFGLPADLDPRWVTAALAAPAAWSGGRWLLRWRSGKAPAGNENSTAQRKTA
ncbi:cation-translocating P-type ATPase C-terminal domain-containing protein [Roseateles sp.]|uniref:cation-translocating P-type ATPase C-terminal domain-containing protein n=1 Tax=Roseateles sp. TaxID=1971397 RepID=UPI0032645C5C